MGSKQAKATVVLALSGLGVLTAYPFQASFSGGLLTAGFTAATVGGLADWFAVEALFRKPLGIPYRTAVISRNRQRIFQLLAETVQKELLLPEKIHQHLAEYDVVKALLRIADGRGSHRLLRGLLYRLVRDMLRPESGAVLAQKGEEMVRELAEHWAIAPRIMTWLQEMSKREEDERIISWLFGKAARWGQSPLLTAVLNRWAAQVLEKYGQGGALRELAVSFAELDPKLLGQWAQTELLRLLTALQNPQHPWRISWRKERLSWLQEKQGDALFLAKLEGWKERLLANARLGGRLQAMLVDRRQAVWLTRRLYGWLRQYQEQLQSDAGKRQQLNEKGKAGLLAWLERNHEEIGRTVLQNLEKFSDQDLVKLIESRAGDDLQMIRINGAVVGGLAGMALYLITCLF
ncbi:DUF445 domain-containing protein [Azotosporobacter soli]|uniref:DUF445 domain-containing protein n=1 Tax=Azotosporobacter soli TaxID=3055040 RepID=UPI0031FEF159